MPFIVERQLLSSPFGKGRSCIEVIDYIFLPIPYLLYLIELERKNGKSTPSEMITAINSFNKEIYNIELTPKGLYSDINDECFIAKYKNKCDNPFKIATDASLFEYWGDDIYELQESFYSIEW